ncbi:MAG: cytochrome d ubiquinol oxidase subunit II [Burkholderiales bacterium]|nr:cytochrome d ubiquinol oxidase subunit II [Burkholderiales bacterium]
MELALTWLLIIAFIIIMYILLDGFTLGTGLLFPFINADNERDVMLATVLPVWDGNETWLVFAGAALYGAFPLAFSILFPIWYLPLMLLIFGLLLRGIAFEFRLKAKRSRAIWDWCLFGGSLMAVIAQGLIIGNYVSGFNLDWQSMAPIPNQWLTWFGIFCAISLIIGYTLLGCARLIKKTSGELQLKFYKISSWLQWLLMLALIFVGIYSPQRNKLHITYWFNLHHSPFMILFLIIIAILFIIHALAIKNKIEKLPFITIVLVFIFAYLALVTSKLPYIVPNYLTFMQARSDDGALLFMLIGAAILIPLLLIYTAYAYRVFGGKPNEKISY